MLPRQLIAQQMRAAVRIAIGIRDSVLHRFDRFRRRTDGIFVGRQLDVLAMGPSEETELLWEGRTELHAPEIDGKLFINDFGDHEDLVPGAFYRCDITEAHEYELVARIID